MGLGATRIACSTLLVAAPAVAQNDPICADRPGQTTPACTVPAGMTQIETTALDWARDRADGVSADELRIGESVIKLGLTERLDIELEAAPFVRIRTRDGGARETLSGFGDIAFAAKYRLTGEAAPVRVAVKPFVKIPTAKRSLGNGKVEGGLVVPIDYAIPGSQLSLALTSEIDINADSDGSGHHVATAQAIGFGASLFSRLSVSADVSAYWDFDSAGTIRQYALGGSAAYLLSNDVQLDAGVNVGLNRETPDIQAYSGIAFRF